MSRREQYLALLGLDVWTQRPAAEPRVAVSSDAAVQGVPATDTDTSIDTNTNVHTDSDASVWERLRAEVAACTRCALCSARTQTVFGVGNRRAQLLVIGEAPGAEEDRRGEPFVGRAGQLLNSMLRAIGCERESVYIANVLKCRPPGNRDPLPGEVAECLPYLQRQIELLAPRLILVVGRIAAQNLLGTDAPISRLRGSVHRFGPGAIPVVVTYHPAYLLRSPTEKRRAWMDLKLARAQLVSAPTPDQQDSSAAARGTDVRAGGGGVGLGDRAAPDGAYSA